MKKIQYYFLLIKIYKLKIINKYNFYFSLFIVNKINFIKYIPTNKRLIYAILANPER